MIRGRFHQNWVLSVAFRGYCSKTDQIGALGDENKGPLIKKGGIPEAPTTCCMTGCPNCVWLDYAEALTEHFKDGGKNAIVEIEKNVTDSNVKAYLMHELRMRNKTS